jgi:hypothetical protein
MPQSTLPTPLAAAVTADTAATTGHNRRIATAMLKQPPSAVQHPPQQTDLIILTIVFIHLSVLDP